MTDFDDPTGNHTASTTSDAGQETDEISYPENHVVGVVDAEHVCQAVDALAAAGFLESELRVRHGATDAGRLDASTGRTGLLDRVLRIAERLGVRNDEMALKDEYEAALHAGDYVVLVLAPTDERKALAADTLRAHDARLVNYFGRFTIARL